MCLRPGFASPSVLLPSAIRELKCIPSFGKNAELLGAVLSNSWNTEGKAGLLGFVFSSDPGCVGWAVLDSSALSLSRLSFLASREHCSGYLWELNACGGLKCLAAG